jgi:CTP synthase (UTP-ammonia lyase)
MRLLAAIGHCLETGTAFLGTCGGFQYTAVALARARLGLAGAGHAESDPDASQHVIVALQCALRSAAARAASCIRFSPPGYGRQPQRRLRRHWAG